MVPGPWDVKNIWAWGIWLGEWQNKIKLIIPYHTNTKAMNKQNNNYKNYEDDEDNNKWNCLKWAWISTATAKFEIYFLRHLISQPTRDKGNLRFAYNVALYV